MDGNELFMRTHERLIRNMLRRHPRMSEVEAYDITFNDAADRALREYIAEFHPETMMKRGQNVSDQASSE